MYVARCQQEIRLRVKVIFREKSFLAMNVVDDFFFKLQLVEVEHNA